jgi:hypothetical protein
MKRRCHGRVKAVRFYDARIKETLGLMSEGELMREALLRHEGPHVSLAIAGGLAIL